MNKKTKEYEYKDMVLSSAQLEVPREVYQRKFRSQRASKIAKDFDERIANDPKVSLRDGKYFVFDGQHTIAARKLLNDGNDLPIKCKVFFGMTIQEEAFLFAQQTGLSAPLTAGDHLRAMLVAEEFEAVAFRDACQSLGVQIDFEHERGAYRLGCIKTAFRLYEKIGEARFKEAMEMIIAAWQGDPDSFRAENILGVAHFVDIYHDVYQPQRLVSQLRHVDPLTIYREGRATGINLPGYKKYLYQVFRIYNGNGKRGSLPMKF